MHGDAPGAGAPEGNRNALEHGLFTRAAREDRKALTRLRAGAKALLGDMD